jgi:hypothetical protein
VFAAHALRDFLDRQDRAHRSLLGASWRSVGWRDRTNTVSPIASRNPECSGHGNALVAWGQTHGQVTQSIDVVQRSSNGSYSPVAVLGTDAVFVSGVAMDPAGDAVVMWQSAPTFPGPLGIEAATREHDGALGAPVPIGPPGVDAGSVAIDRAGRALIAWDRLSNGTEQSVTVTSLQAGATTPGPSQTLRGPGHDTPDAFPLIESDQAGDAVVTWQTTIHDRYTDELVAARATRGRPFAPGIAITPSDAGGLFASAIGPAGATIVAWDSAAGPIRAVVAPNATSAFKATTVVAPASQGAAVAAVGIGTSTHAIVVWWNQNQHQLQYATAR